MKKKVFPDEAVSALMLNRFIPVSVDLDSTHPVSFNGVEYTERSFAENREVAATPTMIFADHDGSILGKTSGYYNADRFLLLLRYVESDLFQDMTFEEFEKRPARRSSNDN
jgi:thioredoxin-related protein